jgi:xylulokinase
MKKSYLVGIDAGVSFVKVAVYDTDGTNRSTVVKAAPSQFPRAGMFLQEADVLFSIIKGALREAVEKAALADGAIEAIGFSGAMAGAMAVDRDWNVVLDWSIISDTRCYPWVTRMLEKDSRRILEQSGTNFPVFGPKMLWWKETEPARYAKVAKFMVLAGYVIGRLAGLPVEQAFIDRTYCHFTGIADVKAGRWSREICGEFGIDQELLPRIVDSTTIVGRLGAAAAKECGLPSGIPLVAGAGDKPAGTLGAGIVTPGLIIDESASFAALSLCVDRWVADTENRTLENLPSPLPGRFLPSIYLFGSGVTHAWFRDTFGEEEKREAAAAGTSAFALLDEKAAKVPPGSEGLLCSGLLGGRGYPSDPDIRGMWIGHSLIHKKEHFYRALLESFAYEWAVVLELMKKSYPDLAIEEIRVIGGGARSDLWNQIKADVTGVPYVRLNRDDFAVLGDVLMAGGAVGIYPDVKAAATRFAGKTRRFEPDPGRHQRYHCFVPLYQEVFNKVRTIFVDLKGACAE